MKKVVKILGIGIGTVIVLGIIFLMVNYNIKIDSWFINLFKLEEISSITIDTLSQYDNKKEFKDEETIKEIYDVFADKKTHLESINDVPVDPDILYYVGLQYSEQIGLSSYLHKMLCP